MKQDRILRGPEVTNSTDFPKNVSVIELLYHSMKNHGDSIVQIEADSGKSITHSEFLNLSLTIAANLKKHGITEGVTVALCTDKSIVSFSIFTAIIFTGATVSVWSTTFSEDEFQHTLNIIQPKMIICSKSTYEKISSLEGAAKSEVFFTDGSSPHSESNILKESDQDFKIYQVKDIENHFPLITFTSGSTGRSKFVLLPNAVMAKYGGSYCRKKISRWLLLGPLYWASTIATFIGSIVQNFTTVLSSFDSLLLLQYSQQYKIDALTILPPMMPTVLALPNISDYDLSSVKMIISAGATLSADLKKKFLEKLFHNDVELNHVYGSSEAGGITWYKYVDQETANKTSSCGKLITGVELKVVDENGQTLGPGSPGEMRVKTTSMMARYIGNPEATASAFDSEGFFCTGDAGFYDEDGFIYHLGRSTDLIRYKNNTLCMTPVEGLLITHPAVNEAVIVGKPDPVDNQQPAAFVVVNPNMKVTEEDIQKFIDDKVDDVYKLRGGVHFLDSLPTLPNGKIIRGNLWKVLQEHNKL